MEHYKNRILYGGIVARHGGGTLTTTNNYWITGDEAVYGIGYSNSNTGATGVTGETLKTYASVLGSAYKNDEHNINSGYPILKWQENINIIADVNTDSTCKNVEIKIPYHQNNIVKVINEEGTELSKTSENVYSENLIEGNHTYTIIDSDNNKKCLNYNIKLINNLNDLEDFRDEVNNGNNYKNYTIIQTADIDLSNKYGENKGSWIPIGDGKYFSGTYNGNGHKVNSIYINEVDKPSRGLFGTIKGAKIYNLTISGNIIGSAYVGGICGYTTGEGNKIVNCKNNATINCETSCVGGIIGVLVNSIDSNITKCENTANISCKQYHAGGIMGCCTNEVANLTIQRCKNTGNCTTGIANAGGILAMSDFNGHVNIYECCNFGYMEAGDTSAGGIAAGVCNGGQMKIKNCYNMGNINGKKGSSGGIIGGASKYNSAYSNQYLMIENCYNTGTVKQIGYYGGIAAGILNTQYIFTNNYWETGKQANYGIGYPSSNTGAAGVSAATLKTYASNLESAYTNDTTPNINNGYPILRWEIEE